MRTTVEDPALIGFIDRSFQGSSTEEWFEALLGLQ